MAKKKNKNSSNSNKDYKALAETLEKEVKELENNLKELKDNIDLLQNGDNEGLYWSGDVALSTNKALLGHYDHDMVLLENVQKCSEYINSVANK